MDFLTDHQAAVFCLGKEVWIKMSNSPIELRLQPWAARLLAAELIKHADEIEKPPAQGEASE